MYETALGQGTRAKAHVSPPSTRPGKKSKKSLRPQRSFAYLNQNVENQIDETKYNYLLRVANEEAEEPEAERSSCTDATFSQTIHQR